MSRFELQNAAADRFAGLGQTFAIAAHVSPDIGTKSAASSLAEEDRSLEGRVIYVYRC